MAKRFIGGGDSDVAPAGSVQAFAGAEAPYGWLLCQGQELNIEDYPKLYEAIGSTWNTQVNPTSGSAYSAPAAGKFRLPDFRGSFLRGAGSPHAGDACTVGGYQAQKTAKNGLANSTSSVSTSGNKNQMNKTSTTYAPQVAVGSRDYAWEGIGSRVNFAAGRSASGAGGGTVTLKTTTHSHNVTYTGTFSTSGTASAQTITGDNETRPLNQGVNYIIKE